MSKQKKIRKRGKIGLTNYFKELKKGDKVAVVREFSIPACFPERIQGLSGVVVSRRGRSYVVRLKQGNKEKEFIIKSVHLKNLK